MRKPVEVVSLSFLDLLSIALGGVTLMVVMLSLSLKPGAAVEHQHFLVLNLRLGLELNSGDADELRRLIESGSLPPLHLKVDGRRDIEFDPRDSSVREEDFAKVRWVVELKECAIQEGKARATVGIYCIFTEIQRPFDPSLTFREVRSPRVVSASCTYNTRYQVNGPENGNDGRVPRTCTFPSAAELFRDFSPESPPPPAP